MEGKTNQSEGHGRDKRNAVSETWLSKLFGTRVQDLQPTEDKVESSTSEKPENATNSNQVDETAKLTTNDTERESWFSKFFGTPK